VKKKRPLVQGEKNLNTKEERERCKVTANFTATTENNPLARERRRLGRFLQAGRERGGVCAEARAHASGVHSKNHRVT